MIRSICSICGCFGEQRQRKEEFEKRLGCAYGWRVFIELRGGAERVLCCWLGT